MITQDFLLSSVNDIPSMKKKEKPITTKRIILPSRLLNILKWRFPIYRIPKIEEYSRSLIEISKKNNQLPYCIQFDINDDGKDEILLIQKSVLDKIGRLLIISKKSGKYKIDKIKWKRPENAVFPDYLIDISKPSAYQTFGINSKNINIKHNHLITKGYLRRIVYWDGSKYCQERI